MAEDEVDRIVRDWQRENPHLELAPLQVFSRVSRLARLLDLERSAAFAAHKLEGWEFDVLAALRRSGAPYELSPSALVLQTLSTSGTMTNRVDRLEARGLVVRRRDPSDRRGILVRLTDAGRDLVDAALADLLHRERERLTHLDPEQQAALADLLRLVVGRFEGA